MLQRAPSGVADCSLGPGMVRRGTSLWQVPRVGADAHTETHLAQRTRHGEILSEDNLSWMHRDMSPGVVVVAPWSSAARVQFLRAGPEIWQAAI